jgi:hypothetical protein
LRLYTGETDVKTNDLINLLAEDAPVPMRLGRAMTIALLIGIVVSAALLLSTVGIRPNMKEAIETGRVLFKIGVTLTLAVAASSLVFRIGRPGVPIRARSLSLIIPLVLVIGAIIAEMTVTPPDSWGVRMVGKHAPFCVFFIPVLSLAPLAGFMTVLRNGAPDNPGVAGAVAGLAAGGVAAAIYAWHCPDDSPFFVATWYSVAIAIVTVAGAVIGRRLLRW